MVSIINKTQSNNKKRNSLLLTSNQSYGMDMLSTEVLELDDLQPSKISDGFDLSFQYSRESDSIGNHLKHSDSSLAQVLSQKESLREISARKRLNNRQDESISIVPKGEFENAEQFLQSYNHNPKHEEPLYTTTANEYGIKKPSMATHNSKMFPKREVLKSFNGIMFKDQGLNTALTRSNVHGQLDPLFN